MKTKIIVLLIGLVVLAGVATAALLPYYGEVTGTVDVDQSVKINEKMWTSPDNIYDGSLVAGSSMMEVFPIKNFAEVQATVYVNDICEAELEDNDCIGVTTSYVGVLDLTTKNPSTWEATGVMEATMLYSLVGEEFSYRIDTTSNLDGYIVVYYPDVSATGTDDPGKKPWNINNAVIIGDVTDVWITSDLSIGLPDVNDYNANPDEGDSYCNGENGYDYYEHCSGAKIWLMPASEFGSWSPEDWLFETDLIAYTQTSSNNFVLPANGGGVNLGIINDFNVALKPDIYTITTFVRPLTVT